jgi:hypothetical protein
MYDKALMDVEDDVHACLAPLPALFSYIVSTDEEIRIRETTITRVPRGRGKVRPFLGNLENSYNSK